MINKNHIRNISIVFCEQQVVLALSAFSNKMVFANNNWIQRNNKGFFVATRVKFHSWQYRFSTVIWFGSTGCRYSASLPFNDTIGKTRICQFSSYAKPDARKLYCSRIFHHNYFVSIISSWSTHLIFCLLLNHFTYVHVVINYNFFFLCIFNSINTDVLIGRQSHVRSVRLGWVYLHILIFC